MLAALVLALGVPGARAAPPPGDAAEHHLFAEVYQDIVEYHIDVVRPGALAMAGLTTLDALDPVLSLTRTGNRVTLRRGATTASFAAPASGDGAGWGDLTGQVVDAARALSPDIAAFPPDRLDERIIDGGLATLDRFSRYVRPAVAREHRAERDGFDGIGVTVDIRDAQVWVAAVQPQTPAAAAGLRPDDRILTIDGTPCDTLSPDALRQRLRGKPDTIVVLRIARRGDPEPIVLSVPRAHIVDPAATLELKDDIAWLKVTSFNQETSSLAAKLIRRAHRRLGARLIGIVLDLRDNPGGLLDQSVDLASVFLDGLPVAATIGRLPESFQNFTAPTNDTSETLPLVVLVNGGSASASEVVAAALQDLRRAVVVGTSSFGKGTVQTVIRTSNNGELTVTWAQLITPLGYHLNHHGVVPNVCTVGLTAEMLHRTRGLAAAMPPRLEQRRDQLDDAAWQKLRQSCPPERVDRSIDFAVARRLLEDPALYSAALEAAPTITPATAEARIAHRVTR